MYEEEVSERPARPLSVVVRRSEEEGIESAKAPLYFKIGISRAPTLESPMISKSS